MRWDKTSLKELIGRSDQAAVRALLEIYKFQTDEEQAWGATYQQNGLGFSGQDSEWLTEMAKRVMAGGSLSSKERAILRNRMKRYWRQLIPVIAAKNRDKVLKQGKSFIILDDEYERI